MKEIPLTQGQTALVDDDDYDWLTMWKWRCMRAGRSFYAVRHGREGCKRTTIYLHRAIMGLSDPKVFVDHADQNGLNNCRRNLRLTNAQGNRRNSRKRAGTKFPYKGIRYVPAKFAAMLGRKHLGYFKTPDDAARAYDKAALELYGEFASLNFPA